MDPVRQYNVNIQRFLPAWAGTVSSGVKSLTPFETAIGAFSKDKEPLPAQKPYSHRAA
ncbi:MAG: hypothetical protein LBG05_05180 [Treponema sp.]|nr:hypothetical protein [Treponema sp.]